MLVKSGVSNRGFVLKNDVEFASRVVVLTGRNGSGKTRFLSAIKENHSRVFINNKSLGLGDILSVDKMVPSFDCSNNHKLDMAKVYSLFSKIEFDKDGGVGSRIQFRVDDGVGGVNILPMLRRMARVLGKSIAELTLDEMELYYCKSYHAIVGGLDVASIFNDYRRSKDTNEQYEFRAVVKNHDVAFLSPELFLERFGPEPWVELNNLMRSVFNGKFLFSEPVAGDRDFSCSYTLVQDNGESIGIDGLSSGESVLLWLVLTLFTSAYIDGEFLNRPKIIVFDEPDAHLHPKMVECMYWAFRDFSERFGCYVIFTTHSPTTVALAKGGDVYAVADNSISAVSKDVAINELLVGVTKIAVDPENRRQVYVESLYDAESFQTIYDFMSSKSTYGLDNGVSLSFIPSGGKVPQSLLINSLRRFAPDLNDGEVGEFVRSVNGVGSCSQVYGTVESLLKVGSRTVRGVVDWDGRNESSDGVIVFSENRAYAIENVILDPLSVVSFVVSAAHDKYPLAYFCGRDVGTDEWAKDDELLQRSVEVFVSKVLGCEFCADSEVKYTSGLCMVTDQRYLYSASETGHSLEMKIVDSFPEIKKLIRREGDLKRIVASLHMTKNYSSRFIPSDFLSLFKALHLS